MAVAKLISVLNQRFDLHGGGGWETREKWVMFTRNKKSLPLLHRVCYQGVCCNIFSECVDSIRNCAGNGLGNPGVRATMSSHCQTIFGLRLDNLAGIWNSESHKGKCCSLKNMAFDRGLVSTSEEGYDTELGGRDFDSDDEPDEMFVEQETLQLFEWQAICLQVAQFASTPMGINIAKEGYLSIGTSRKESEELLDQTAAAQSLASPLDFTGINNLQGVITEAIKGRVCQSKELCTVKYTLIGVQRVHDQLGCRKHRDLQISRETSITGLAPLAPLKAILEGCDLCSDIVQEIDHCLDCTLLSVLDRASPALAAVRLKRQENLKSIDTILKVISSMLVQRGGIDSALVTRRRARLCVAVRASHKSLLPGGITLDVSNSGATLFIEPEPALELNNREMQLAGQEKDEEISVLRSITEKLVDKAEAIIELLGRITILDLACARSSHASWLGSVQPVFYNKKEIRVHPNQDMALTDCLPADIQEQGSESHVGIGSDDLRVDIRSISHPLLLGAMLPALPASQRFGRSGAGKSLSAIAKPVTFKTENEKLPVPIDIQISSRVKVVTITGPNTGGKTATLKTLGVAAIMSKAGLFLPAVGHPRLPWFDHILADVGDGQSLERSLSTFSGHIRRMCLILEACTENSLVLLDEIGVGTDPSEGAALATATLKHLANKASLCVATTHSAELKVMKESDPRFENASVEFDIETLRPTYRVLWGIPGQSNALNIAEFLGLDAKVLARARELVTKFRPSEFGICTSELLGSLVEQSMEQQERARRASELLSKARALHSELQAAADSLIEREVAWRKFQVDAELEKIAKAKVQMDKILERYQEACENCSKDDARASLQVAQAEIAAVLEESSQERESVLQEFLARVLSSKPEQVHQTQGAKVFSLGDRVLVKKLGKVPATVIDLPQQDTDQMTVRLGNINMQVKLSEVLKVPGTGSTAAKHEKKLKFNHVKQSTVQNDSSGSSDPKFEAAVQTTRNTLDLRGMSVSDAVRELSLTLASRSPHSVLFIIHGIGTGVVKEAVWQSLHKHPFVLKFEEESLRNGGCTIAYIK